MTADIRTAAQREAFRYWRHRWSPQHVTTVDMTGTINAPQWEPVNVLTDAELAARVTPTRAQIESAIMGRTATAGAKAVIALMAGLAEGESNAQTE